MKKRVAIIAPTDGPGKFDFITGFFINPPYGIFPVSTKLKNSGYDVKVFSEIVSSDIDWDYVYNADYIAFCILQSYCSHKSYDYAYKIKQDTNIPIIFGGCHPSLLPEECLDYCDYVVRKEGEDSILDLLDALENGRDLSTIKGISYKSNGHYVHNPDRELVKDIDDVVDLSLIHNYKPLSTTANPRKAFVKHGKVHCQPIQTSRGCPHNCKFCICPREFGQKYRTRSIETIITEIENGLTYLKNNNFIFVDNDFALDKERAKRLARAIIDKFGEDNLLLTGFTRCSVAKDTELLDLLKRAGFKVLVLGIESTDNKVLEEINKGQTFEQTLKYIDIIQSHGLGIWAAMIVGADNDTVETIEKSVDFLNKKDFLMLGLNSLTPSFYQTKVFGDPQHFPDNRYIHQDWRFFTGAFVCHYPKQMKPSTLQKGIINGYSSFYAYKKNGLVRTLFLALIVGFGRIFRIAPKMILSRYCDMYLYAKIIRPVYNMRPLYKHMKNYIKILEKFEEGMYDENEQLIEDKLPSLNGLQLQKRLPIKSSSILVCQ